MCRNPFPVRQQSRREPEERHVFGHRSGQQGGDEGDQRLGRKVVWTGAVDVWIEEDSSRTEWPCPGMNFIFSIYLIFSVQLLNIVNFYVNSTLFWKNSWWLSDLMIKYSVWGLVRCLICCWEHVQPSGYWFSSTVPSICFSHYVSLQWSSSSSEEF